jgi:hypothetical protein
VRVWLVVYGVLYVVIEMTGSALSSIGWPRITALDVASAVIDAFLAVSVALAALLAVHLAARRWGPRLLTAAPARDQAEVVQTAPIGVRSWRAEPTALPAAPAPAPAPLLGTYQVGAYGTGSRHRSRRTAPTFPEEPGTLL